MAMSATPYKIGRDAPYRRRDSDPEARERPCLMTMFSMKPKFNLAEFLAEPAKPSVSRRRSMSYSSPKAQEAVKAEDVAAPKPKAP
jgi:hypothetical protein